MADDAPHQRRWGPLLAALLAFLLVPDTPVVQSIAPVGDSALVLIPALAACTVLGLASGGRVWLAIAWCGAAAAVILLLPARQPAFGALERGWSLVLAGAFGVVGAASGRGARFFPRALGGVCIGSALAAALTLATPAGPRLIERTARADVRARPNAALAWVRATDHSVDWQAVQSYAGGGAALETAAATADAVLASVPQDAVLLFPALLGLESLAGLAIAWSLYHRISRARIGEPLGRLREFRFNDHLIWGLLIGILLLVTPAPAAWRWAGVNAVVFFGALYATRGLAVLAWVLDQTRASGVAVLALAVLASVLSAPAAMGLGLIGVADTWLDWRSRGPGAATRGPT